jgi:O-antigen ligase
MLLFLAAAMPVRFVHGLPLLSSASVLDVAVVIAGASLWLDLAFRPLDTGYPQLFALLCAPPLIAVVSLAWSHDRSLTLRTMLEYTEGLILYLFVIRELAGLSAQRVTAYISRYAYLMIIPAIFLLLHVPGFQPRVQVRHTSGDYLTYFSRFSHPILGPSNNLATVLAFVAPLLLYVGHARANRRATFAGAAAAIAIVLTLSRGVLLSFAIGALLYPLLTIGRGKGAATGFAAKVAATVALAGVGLGIFYLVNPPTHAFFANRLSSANLHVRAKAYEYAAGSIAKHPFVGLGAGVVGAGPQAPTAPPAAAATLLPVATAPAALSGVDIHNTYLQQALYFGIPLAALLSLMLFGIVGFFVSRSRLTPLAGVIAYTVLVELVSFAFESSFEGTILRMLFYLSIGLLAAVLRANEQEEEHATTAH